jgi:superfamily II DNA or RNA helicase
MMTKPSHKLSFQDRLSHLTFFQASKLLGAWGRELIRQGGANRDVDLKRDVHLSGNLLRVEYPGIGGTPPATATLTLKADAKDGLHWHCTACQEPCEHVGALLSVLLENKTALGLAAPPEVVEPSGGLSDAELINQAIAERAERARKERMKIRTMDASKPWTDYGVTSALSGKTYRVALGGFETGVSYCSCPDFRTNTLGTCKHVIKVSSLVKRKFSASQLRRPYRRTRIAVHLRYDREISLRLETPADLPAEVYEVIAPLLEKPITNVLDLLARLQKLERMQQDVQVYPDAEEFIQQQLHTERIQHRVEEIRRAPAKHQLRTQLLKVPLLPYQLDGIAFAVGAGRAVLADDMGLGKTIQGVGVAELLAREAGIRKVLIVCPASLKSQWRSEIQRFCDRDAQLVSGRTAERGSQYANDCFFTVCNYEQLLKDILAIEQTPWDLIVLDEGQRIKNWEAKTSRVIKGLKSRFALVLSGTPLENRLDELYSVVQFIDDRRLGPAFRFFSHFRVVDEKGKVVGYKNLDDLRERLRPILLRRTRDSVKLELPDRTDEIVRIAPTGEQKELHDTHMRTVAQIVGKKFLTEMDLLRLRAALLMCRMSANSTYLVTKQEPGFSSKLERLAELFDEIAAEGERKVVLFSEWTKMLNLIEPLLDDRRLRFVRLDGSVPQKQRQELVHEFQKETNCRLFLTTNAGSTGLNLQAANTVINVDLPWNPAVLEQRVGRAHRMGQTQPVQVFVLVTEETLEENLLNTLNAKRDLFLAALDSDSDVDKVSLVSGAAELRSRLEVLLGAKAEAPVDESQKRLEEAAARRAAGADLPVRERVATAGGAFLGAVFQFLGALAPQGQTPEPATSHVDNIRKSLGECMGVDSVGRPTLTLTLPDAAAVNQLAQTLARLLVGQKLV